MPWRAGEDEIQDDMIPTQDEWNHYLLWIDVCKIHGVICPSFSQWKTQREEADNQRENYRGIDS